MSRRRTVARDGRRAPAHRARPARRRAAPPGVAAADARPGRAPGRDRRPRPGPRAGSRSSPVSSPTPRRCSRRPRTGCRRWCWRRRGSSRRCVPSSVPLTRRSGSTTAGSRRRGASRPTWRQPSGSAAPRRSATRASTPRARRSSVGLARAIRCAHLHRARRGPGFRGRPRRARWRAGHAQHDDAAVRRWAAAWWSGRRRGRAPTVEGTVPAAGGEPVAAPRAGAVGRQVAALSRRCRRRSRGTRAEPVPRSSRTPRPPDRACGPMPRDRRGRDSCRGNRPRCPRPSTSRRAWPGRCGSWSGRPAPPTATARPRDVSTSWPTGSTNPCGSPCSRPSTTAVGCSSRR